MFISSFPVTKIAKKAIFAWRGSSGHRKNMLGESDSIGVGVAKDMEGELHFVQCMGIYPVDPHTGEKIPPRR